MAQTDFLLLNEKEIRSCVGLDLEALAAVEDGFSRLARGEAILPAPIGIDVPERHAEIHVKTAYVKGLDGFALKIASGFYKNPELGLPVSSGLMLLLSAATGRPQALLLDNAYLTEIRTALAGAIAAKHLAKRKIETVGVVGAGMQARFQVQALKLVREFRRVLVYARKQEAVDSYIKDVSSALEVEVVSARSISDLVRASDVVVTATPAREPLVFENDLHPGDPHHCHGLRWPGKTGARSGSPCSRASCGLRFEEPERAASARCSRRVFATTPLRWNWGKSPPASSPGGATIARSRSATSPGSASKTQPSPSTRSAKASARGLGTRAAL